MIHLKDSSKPAGIRCNRWNKGYIRILEKEGDPGITCKTCLGKRNQNSTRAINLIGFNLVGKILYKSWGYNMTMNTYYLITKQGNKSVEAVEIGSKHVESTGYMAGTELPDPTRILKDANHDGKPIKFVSRAAADGSLGYFVGGKLSHSKSYWLHDGRPNSFNHCD